MGLTDTYSQNEMMKRKAAAYDEAQNRSRLKDAFHQGFSEGNVNSMQTAMNNSLVGGLAGMQHAQMTADRQLNDAKAAEAQMIMDGRLDPRQTRFLSRDDVSGLMQGLAGMSTNMGQVQ